MKKSGVAVLVIIYLMLSGIAFTALLSRETIAQEKKVESSKLCVVWTSADKEVAMKTAFMYTFNAKKQGWFDQVRLVVWGPSARLLAQDKELQEYLAKMKDAGVELLACKACADMYGVSEKIGTFGVDVKYMGQPLTEMLKTDWKTLTF